MDYSLLRKKECYIVAVTQENIKTGFSMFKIMISFHILGKWNYMACNFGIVHIRVVQE